MSHCRHRSLSARRRPAMPRAARAPAASPLAQAMLGLLLLAAITVLSLPEARAVSASLGWVPFWLLALPASAWLALQLPRRASGTAQATMRPGHRWRAHTSRPRRWLPADQRAARSVSAA